MNTSTRYEQNINILTQLKKGNIQKDLLKTYSGWGGLRKAIYQPEVYRELQKILSADEIKSLKNTLSSAYYTPKQIVTFMYDFLGSLGFTGGAILEPAVGNGVFIEHMPEAMRNASRIDCVEIDKITSDICKALYPDIRLYNRPFEQFNPTPRYDLIIGNPPYGPQTVCDARHSDLNDYRIHHYFAAKSMRLLKEGGILAMVLPQYFLDNESKHVRDIIAHEGGELIAAYRLPDDLFNDAKVTVDIVFLRKGKQGKEGKKPNALSWTKTPKVLLSGYHKPLALNEYFHQHKNHIIGKLVVTDIYERKGLTCRKNGDDTFKILQGFIEKKTQPQQPEKIITGFQKQLNDLNQKLKEVGEAAQKIFLDIQAITQQMKEAAAN